MIKKQTRIKALIIPILFISAFFFAFKAKAATYYVSPNGTASWVNCSNVATPCSLATANANVNAGDSVYLRGGTYQDKFIKPAKTGSVGNYIKYISYPGERAVLTGRGTVISNSFSSDGNLAQCYIHGKSYVWIQDITINKVLHRSFHIESSDHIVLKNNVVSGVTSSQVYSKIAFFFSDYLYSEGNRFEGADSTSEYDLIREKALTHALFYKDYFGSATHDSYDSHHEMADGYQIFKECEFEPRPHTGLSIGGGATDMHGSFNLIQDCRFHDAGADKPGLFCINHPEVCDGCDPALYMKVDKTIVRNNVFYDNNEHITMRWSTWKGDLASTHGNRIYNNVFFNALIRQGYTPNYCAGTFLFAEGNSSNLYYDNLIYNNIFSESAKTGRQAYWYNYDGNNQNIRDNKVENNIWHDSDSIPTLNWGFSKDKTPAQLDTLDSQWTSNYSVNPSLADPSNRNFRLKSNSPAIDKGRAHARATNSGANSTVLGVNDPLTFFSVEAWNMVWHQGLDPTLKSDMIKIGTGIPVRIKGINYTSKTLTLSGARSWNVNDPVYYCHKDICFSGSAPDMGAFEYTGSAPTYIQGDLNKDGKVDIADYSMFIQDFGKTGANLAADLNKNGQVEIGDYSIFINNFGKTS